MLGNVEVRPTENQSCPEGALNQFIADFVARVGRRLTTLPFLVTDWARLE